MTYDPENYPLKLTYALHAIDESPDQGVTGECDHFAWNVRQEGALEFIKQNPTGRFVIGVRHE